MGTCTPNGNRIICQIRLDGWDQIVLDLSPLWWVGRREGTAQHPIFRNFIFQRFVGSFTLLFVSSVFSLHQISQRFFTNSEICGTAISLGLTFPIACLDRQIPVQYFFSLEQSRAKVICLVLFELPSPSNSILF